MTKQLYKTCAILVLAATATWAATLESVEDLYFSGDLDATRAEIHDLLSTSEDDAERASALKLLGQLEVDSRNWGAALEAWGELTDRHALSAQATAISPAIRPLQALVECDCDAAEPAARTAAVDTTPLPALAVPDPVPAPPVPAAPPVTVEPADGDLVVGAWGTEYDAAQEVGGALIEFLDSQGVGVKAGSTEIPAIRGEEVTLSFLIEEARAAGAEGVLFITTRFGHREFVRTTRYDTNGVEVWTLKVTGGTALKEKRYRGKVTWGLVDRAKKKLQKKIGTPELPTRS